MKRISYLGPEGTFSHEALLKYCGNSKEIISIPMPTIVDVIKSIDKGEADEGVAPIENSIEGSVNITQDVLTFESEAKIIRELTLPIKHNLIAKKGVKIKNIKKIISHPHATAQCRMFLSANLPDAEIIAANSTAEAIKKLTNLEPDAAAIGTKTAAQLYDLEIIADDIEDSKVNKTRFIFLGSYIPSKSGLDKTSIVCFLKKDKPGSLFNILKEFADRNINLTKIESRPARKEIGDYVFMIDMEGHIHDRIIYDAIESLRRNVYMIKILGSYPVWDEKS
ncbi:MAG: prephenate dehydratase [Actinobacteria bacterium]|nr:prephenate dehydratase [Deltaproteobacteria bacterium]MCL5772718.1 prephenate dehydratase [Actinomycetota bacterium]